MKPENKLVSLVLYKTTEQADSDLIKIYVQGVLNFGKAQAEKYHSGLIKTFYLLGENPSLARERQEFKPPVRLHFYESHVIVYLQQDGYILIVRILHGRQDWEQHLK
jgi:toxin ParE1/3/4